MKSKKYGILIIVCISLIGGRLNAKIPNNQVRSPIPASVIKSFNLDTTFYKKCVMADVLPIISSAKVPDQALLQTRKIILRICQYRHDILRKMVEHKVRLGVMSVSELTTDMPEQRYLAPKDYWNKRARGLGATLESPLVSCAEENVLGYYIDRYHIEDILIHEFAHVIHQMGMYYIDSEFDKKLGQLYENAKKKGLWANTYAGSNYSEYWAEGVQSWFNVNSTRTGDGVHNGIYSREQLKKYDPELYKFITSVFKSSTINVRNISKHFHPE